MATKKPIEKTKTSSRPRLVAVDNKKAAAPLIVEPHPKDYTGFPFITLIQYRKQPMLVIVDNADDEAVRAYVLDLCGPEHVDEEAIISVATEWYSANRASFPISIEFSRRGMTSVTSKVYRALSVEFVSRIIGPVPKYPMGTIKSIKRRRRKAIPTGIEVHSNNVISAEELFQ